MQCVHGVEVLGSAFGHGIAEEDVHHALERALVVEDVGKDPAHYLVLGPDQAADLLELVVLDRPQGPVIIHAMAMRTYRALLPGLPGEDRRW